MNKIASCYLLHFWTRGATMWQRACWEVCKLNEQQEQDKSIPQQVIEDTLAKLEGKDEFPKTVVNKLQELAAKGSLDSQKAIIQAINIGPEE